MSQTAILRHRRDVSSAWTSNNPILEEGQLGFETDTLKYKLGDGVTQWNGLNYANTVASITRGATWGMSSGGPLTGPFPEVTVYFPRSAEIRGVNVLTQDANGSCEIDILLETFAGFPGSPASIVASAPPAITAGRKHNDTTLTGWTTSIPAGSVLTFVLVSSATFKVVSVVLDLLVDNQ